MERWVQAGCAFRLMSLGPFSARRPAGRIGAAAMAAAGTLSPSRPDVPRDARPDVPRNARGVIAEHYRDLQSLALVERARASRAVEPASDQAFLRTVLQACEIALYNLSDLLERAAESGD